MFDGCGEPSAMARNRFSKNDGFHTLRTVSSRLYVSQVDEIGATPLHRAAAAGKYFEHEGQPCSVYVFFSLVRSNLSNIKLKP